MITKKDLDEVIKIWNDLQDDRDQYGKVGYFEISYKKLNLHTTKFNKKLGELLSKVTEK